MTETKDILVGVNETLAKLSKEMPEQMAGFSALMKAVSEKGALGIKEKELIALAIAVAKQCKYCIAVHVKKAIEQGASRDEILEAAWVAVLMHGGPALMYIRYVLDALDELEDWKCMSWQS